MKALSVVLLAAGALVFLLSFIRIKPPKFDFGLSGNEEDSRSDDEDFKYLAGSVSLILRTTGISIALIGLFLYFM